MKWFGHSPFLLLALSLASAYFCAIVFVVVLYYSLPSTDSAYGQGLLNTFGDPFVVATTGVIATVCGVMGFVVSLFCLRGRDLFRCGAFVVGTATVALLVLTPFVGRLAVLVALCIALFSLVFCRYTKIEYFLSA